MTPGPGLARRMWLRLCRLSFTRSRLSRRSLDRFVAGFASDGPALVVHSVDIDRGRHFPNATTVSARAGHDADLRADPAYEVLRDLDPASHDLVVCTGLLEHVAEPDRLVADLHRILRPGGRLIVSASAVFPFHGAPDNYFHFTPHGLRHLFRDWSGFDVLQGSTRPYATVAVLLHRINLQCDVVPPVRLLNEALMHLLPRLDRFVLRQYDTMAHRGPSAETDHAMPAALHAVVVR